MHIIKARNNALFVNNSPSHGAYTCTCTESRSVLFDYLKLLCSSHVRVSVKLSGILFTLSAFIFFPNFYIVKSTISFLFIDWPSWVKKRHIKSFKDSRFTLFPFQVMFSLCDLWLVAMQIKPYTDYCITKKCFSRPVS